MTHNAAITSATVADLLGRWWCAYDEGEFAELGALLTADTRFTCRTDTGQTSYEEFVRADVTGRDQVVAWQTEHRRASPYPLRHHATNVHLTGAPSETEARFRSYLCVVSIADGSPRVLSSGVATGAARREDGQPRLSELHVVLDTATSIPFAGRG